MSFPSLLKSSWIPNSSLELSICSTLLACFFFPSLLLQASSVQLPFLLTDSCADLNITFLSPQSPLPATPMAGSLYAVFMASLLPWKWVDPPLLFSSSVALAGHPAADSNFCSLFLTDLLNLVTSLTD
jgi:hypothetical protein